MYAGILENTGAECETGWRSELTGADPLDRVGGIAGSVFRLGEDFSISFSFYFFAVFCFFLIFLFFKIF